MLHRKCEKSGEAYSYISCPFRELINDQFSQIGKREQGGQCEPGGASAVWEKMSCLNSRQREYLQGIRWERHVVYHRLNRRMLEIIGKLYEAGAYSGACFFVTEQEKLTIPAR